MKTVLNWILIFFATGVVFYSCTDPDDPPETQEETGKIAFNFKHLVNGQELIKDSMNYINAAGNHYEINEIQYFISDVKLYKAGGNAIMIHKWKDICYIDIDIPSTLRWEVFDDIPAGNYDSVTFVFGIPEEKNQSFMYVNPPEVNMFWPDVLGGGYHYLKLNGQWRDTTNTIQPFNFHLGIGQLYKGNVINTDSIYAFVQNYFTVSLPGSAFTVNKNQTQEFNIIMNIESWFETPFIYDHNYWGGAIMQNQQAMQAAKENGKDVFELDIMK